MTPVRNGRGGPDLGDKITGLRLGSGADAVPDLSVDLLGPLRVSLADRVATPTRPRLRTLLAVLSMSAGRAVAVDHLVAALWGDQLPDHPRSSLHTSLSRLRTVVGRDRIGTVPTGVLLRIDPDRVDALRFERLLDRSARTADPAARRVLLGEALGLWRGAPFEDVPAEALHRTWAPRLVERYLAAMEQRIDLDTAGGHDDGLIPLLGELTEAHPLRESLWSRYLAALRHAGRHAEALERYEIVRRRLADELGTDPGAELQRLHADLLAESAPALPPAAPPPAPLTPQVLPIGTAGFVGRDRALAQLDEIRDLAETENIHTTTIVAVTGAAGIGKTALVVRWAHRAAAGYPDGRLYIDLRGFDPAAAPLTPSEALRQFLDAFGVPPERIPAEPPAQVNLYRSLLADKRVLIVLDNARDVDQVRPLLPGAPGAMVVVTSRNQLAGLIAQGARPVQLELLPDADARRLLATRLGESRTAAEPDAVGAIVEHCAGLPLALSVVAARAALHPDFRLADLAAELRDVQQGLDVFCTQDAATDLRAVFSWSYGATAAAAARLFRLLSLHPGPDLSAAAAAALDGRPLAEVRASLAELCRTSLLGEPTPGRYALHDLLRAYAAELLAAEDTEDDRRAAMARMLDHYLHSAHAADLLLDPRSRPVDPPPARPGVVPEQPADLHQARTWFAAEYRVVIAVLARAADAGLSRQLWRLAWYLSGFLVWRGYRTETRQVWRDALAAAGEGTERDQAEALSLRVLARVDLSAGFLDDAQARFSRLLELGERSGDVAAVAGAHRGLGMVHAGRERYDLALDHAQRAVSVYEASGDPAALASALNAVGWYQALMGDFEPALEHCQRAVALLSTEPGERIRLGSTWDSLGYIRVRLNQLDEALACYGRAVEVLEEFGMGAQLPHTLDALGDVHLARGDVRAAADAWRRAQQAFEAIGHDKAATVAAKLAAHSRR